MNVISIKRHYDDSQISGFINEEEQLILRNIAAKPQSPHRKKTYRMWICESEHSFHYKVLRCPACESTKVDEITKQTAFNPVNYEMPERPEKVVEKSLIKRSGAKLRAQQLAAHDVEVLHPDVGGKEKEW